MMEWQSQGSCKGKPLDWFFFKNLETEQVYPQVKELCAGCPVRHDCLKDAIETRSVGIWAGTTTADRRNPLRQRRELKAQMTDCGSYGGYRKHLRNKTPTCYQCRVARNTYVTMQRRGGYQYGPTLREN
jgi:WhiB family redox-sensing transcriptional regulator